MGTIIRNVKHQKEEIKHEPPRAETQTQATAFFSKSMRGMAAKKNSFPSGARRHPGFEEAAGLCVCCDGVAAGCSK